MDLFYEHQVQLRGGVAHLTEVTVPSLRQDIYIPATNGQGDLTIQRYVLTEEKIGSKTIYRHRYMSGEVETA